jgi:FkbM family methyltransferase
MIATMLSRVGALPGVRRLRDHPAVERAFALAHHSRLVDHRARFWLWEWTRAPLTVRYTPRGTTIAVSFRHGTSDLNILEEIFGLGFYEMPADVRVALGDGRLRILDLGGHIGLFGAWALTRFPDAELTTLEPDPANAALLADTIAAYSGLGQWRLITAAAAAVGGLVSFHAGGYAESRASDSEAVQVAALDALELMRGADFVKVDIEGGEWQILEDERLADLPTRVMALEYHPQGAPDADYGAAAHARLQSAGFRTRDIPNPPIGAGMLWAWRDLRP